MYIGSSSSEEEKEEVSDISSTSSSSDDEYPKVSQVSHDDTFSHIFAILCPTLDLAPRGCNIRILRAILGRIGCYNL